MDRIKDKIESLVKKGWTIEEILDALNKGINILEEENSLATEYERKKIRDNFFKKLLKGKTKLNLDEKLKENNT